MKDGTPPRDLAALRHPMFWAALVLLVVNDHVLKGSGLLPGWLTGKLSDFAGLIVAPIVLSVLLLARTRRRRALAFALVGGWFAAANLFVPVAEATSGVAAWIGLSWTFWVDPTDLVALAVLPLAWQLSTRPRARTKRSLEGLALGLGVAACVASPPPEPFFATNAFVYNDTGRALEVRVRWVQARVDCEAIAERPAEALPRDVFGPGTVFLLAEDATLPLDRGIAAGGDIDPRFGGVADDGTDPNGTGHLGTCDAALISTEGMPDTVVFWDGLPFSVIPDVVEDDDDRAAVEGGLRLIASDSSDAIALREAPGYALSNPVEIYDGGDACRDYGTVTGFDWSELPTWTGRPLRFTDVRPTVDGCVFVTIVDADPIRPIPDVSWEAFICVPPEDFPFHPNAVVRIWTSETELRIVRELEVEGDAAWVTGELIVRRGVGVMEEGPFSLSLQEIDASCRGIRMGCGGFRLPAAGALRMGGTTRFVHPGEIVERTAADGRRARLRVGRAETMWVTQAACGAGRDELGPRLEALVVYGEEPR